MWKRMLIMLILAGAGIWALYTFKAGQIRAAIAQGESFVMPPVAVSTTTVEPVTWQPVLSAIGSLKAVNGVEVSTDLPGIITEIAFESGKRVKRGDLLVRLDTTQEEAQLKSAQAGEMLAKVNLDRQRDLLGKRATSQSEYDTAAANADQARASVDEVRARIARKTILSPFDGVLGIRKIDIGQYLEVGKPIVSLESMDPIRVEFAVPQQELAHVGLGKNIVLKAAGLEGKRFEGEITAVDSRVDATTRNLTVEGTLGNSEGLLRPGMFVGVEVLLAEKEGVLTVPASAIAYAPYGDSVFIIRPAEATGAATAPGLTATQQFVKLGETRGDRVVILSGIKAGDKIATSGVFKLQSGAAVTENNEILPGNELHPTPPET